MTQQDTITFELGTISPDQALLYAQQFITTSGYTDPEHVDNQHDTIVAMGLGLLEDCPPWARGDHVNNIKARLGRNLSAHFLRQLARLYKVSKARVSNNATTAKQWPQARRWATEHVGYSHHECLNGLPPNEQDALMELADANGWSCDELAAHRYGSSEIPDNGSAQPSIYSGIPDDDNPPYCDNAQYQDTDSYLHANHDNEDFVYVPREPLAAARKIRSTFSDDDVAMLVAELMRSDY